MPGATLYYRGQFEEARACHEKAVAVYDDRERTKFWTAYTGHNAGVTHRCYLALTLWHLGFPDQALQIDREMRELARTIGHPFTLGHAVDFTAFLSLLLPARRPDSRRRPWKRRPSGRSKAFRCGTRSARFTMARRCSCTAGATKRCRFSPRDMHAFRATGAELRVPSYLGLLGDAYRRLDDIDDAHRSLDEGLAALEKNDDRCHEPELHRLKGELWLAESADGHALPRNAFVAPSRRLSVSAARRGN